MPIIKRNTHVGNSISGLCVGCYSKKMHTYILEGSVSLKMVNYKYTERNFILFVTQTMDNISKLT